MKTTDLDSSFADSLSGADENIEDAIRERMKTVKNETEKRESDALIKRPFNPECAFDRKYSMELAALAIAPHEVGWFWKLRERIHWVVHHH